MSETTAADAWMRSRASVWNQWLGDSRVREQQLSVEQAQRRIERYRALARDLATARRLLRGSRTTSALEALYLAAHASIDRAAPASGARLRRLFRDEIPEAIAALRPTIQWIALLLVLAAGAGWWLISTFPELITLVASPKMIDQVEHGKLWTDDILNITPSSILSVRILSNNIVVTLFAFCTGIFFGLGAFYIIALNGLMLGAMMAFTHQHGMAGELLKFVLAHGPVELSVMCIAGACGTAMGEALIRPRARTRREAFQLAATACARVLFACALLLIVCGCIEGYVSPNPHVPMAVRALIGVSYWVVMVLFLRGAPWRSPFARLAPPPAPA